MQTPTLAVYRNFLNQKRITTLTETLTSPCCRHLVSLFLGAFLPLCKWWNEFCTCYWILYHWVLSVFFSIPLPGRRELVNRDVLLWCVCKCLQARFYSEKINLILALMIITSSPLIFIASFQLPPPHWYRAHSSKTQKTCTFSDPTRNKIVQ